MREFAAEFYSSQAWKDCRSAYTKSVGGLCEACLAKGIYKAGEIVHHKVHLSPDNIGDPAVTLNPANLRLVCRDCHAKEHGSRKADRRYLVDAAGRVTPK